MAINYIVVRTNPGYQFDEVINTINNNFSSVTTSFLYVTGGTISGDLIISGIISGGTFYGDGSNLSGVSSANYYTTGGTLVGTIINFDRNDLASAYSVELSGLTSGITFSGDYLPLSGGTVTGNTLFASGLTVSGSGFTVSNDSYFTTSNGQIKIDLSVAGNPAINFNYASGVNQGNISAASNNLYIDSNSGSVFLRGTAGIVSAFFNNGQVKINDTNGLANNAQLEINNNSASRVGLFVNGIAGQTANLQEWQITGLTSAFIDYSGGTHAQSIAVSGNSIFDFGGGIDLKVHSVSSQPGIWINQSSPNATNFALLGSVNDTFLNAGSSANVYFSIGGNQVGNYNSSRFTFINPVSATTLSATTLVTDSYSGQANSATTLDWSIASNFDYTITANTQFTFNNSKNGSQILVSVANNTSTSNLTVTWSASTATIYWSDGVAPTQSSNTGRTDVYSFMRINNKIYGSYIQNFY